MPGWAQDPELLATFNGEVAERLASLNAGLLTLEAQPERPAEANRGQLAALFRDAHTIKGTARMLGLEGVVRVAHRMEDLLGDLRDGRLPPLPELVDLLLAAGDAIAASLPGRDVAPPDLEVIAARLEAARGLNSPTDVVVPSAAVTETLEPVAALDEAFRVEAARLYATIDGVGELAVLRRRVAAGTTGLAELASRHGHWARRLRGALADGNEPALALAMVPFRRVLGGFPRLVRDLGRTTGHRADLVVTGEDTEIDKQVLDAILDPLTHLVVNAVDHGIESPDARRAAGKDPVGTVTIRVEAQGSNVLVEVADDGRGVDIEAALAAAHRRGLAVPLEPDGSLHPQTAFQLLFAPGFSTREEVSDTSGRGVGLDAVRDAVESLSGTVAMTSTPGAGSVVRLVLPVTLGVTHCLVVRCGAERFALPLGQVQEVVNLRDVTIGRVGGAEAVVRDDGSIPMLDLGATLGVVAAPPGRVAVLAATGGRALAWRVDAVERELELVTKSLGTFLPRVPGVTGAAITTDGSVLCVLDLREVADRFLARPPAAPVPDAAVPPPPARVLVVEDSLGVRELERVILTAAGYEVVTCVDGQEAAARLAGDPFDAVVTDVEMPGIDGIELTARLRQTPAWSAVPVVIMTSRGSDDDRRRGLAAGADAYLTKQDFDQATLVATVRRLIGR